MATTSPDNIYSPNIDDNWAVPQAMGAMADSVQAALSKRANFYVGTSQERQNFTPNRPGVHWQDTNAGWEEFVFKSGVWTPVREKVEIASISPAPGVTISAYNELVKQGNLVTASIRVDSAGFSANTNKVAGTIPVGFRPKHTNIHYLAYTSGNSSNPEALVIFSNNGNFTVRFFASSTYVYAQGVSWYTLD